MKTIINKTIQYVKSEQEGESTGHDWWHTYRVWQMSRHLAEGENVNTQVVELAALLHDIADFKFHGGDDSVGPKVAREWLEKQDTKEEDISHVCEIIKNISYKGANVSSKMESLEGKIVQDADRLDALGAIGIARTFAYGGKKDIEILTPIFKPNFTTRLRNTRAQKAQV